MADTATLFVGTYTNLGAEGIYTCRMDVDSGMLEQVAVVGGIDNPSFLAVDPSGEHLYAVCETHDDEGASDSISAYSIGDDGSLTLLNVESTGGPGPCHLAVDSTDSYVIVANYYGGSVCILPVEADGSLGPRCDFVLHEGSSIDPERQFEPFAHSVTIDSSNSRAYVCDLGMDKILVYRIDHEQGRLIEETGFARVDGAWAWTSTLRLSSVRQILLRDQRDGIDNRGLRLRQRNGKYVPDAANLHPAGGVEWGDINRRYPRFPGRAVCVRVQQRTRLDSHILGRSGHGASDVDRT